MPRLLILPGLLAPLDGPYGGEPDLLGLLARVPSFARARVRRLTLPPLDASGESMPPEAFWLGLRPGEGRLAPGPLRVAALGEDPPPRSVHLCLDYLGLEDGRIADPGGLPDAPAFRTLLAGLVRPPFRLLPGEQGRDALVWEGAGRFRTVSPAEALGKTLSDVRPEGEPWIERFVDDAANLLLGSEPNRRRADEGEPPVLLAWPWGAGERLPVPNLPLRLGRPLGAVGGPGGGPEAFRGLARLAGAKPRPADATIEVLDGADARRARGGFEELEAWTLRDLLPRLADLARDPLEPAALLLPDAWNPTAALWLGFVPNRDGEGEPRRDLLADPKTPALPLPGAIETFLAAE